MGFDAFALNVISTDAWSINAISYLFRAAAAVGYHLFFSFDMTHFSDPSQFIWLLKMYIGNPAYYLYDSLPFVSMLLRRPSQSRCRHRVATNGRRKSFIAESHTGTFYGSTLTFGQSSPQNGWHVNYKQALSRQGINTYFIPAFSDSSIPPSDMYNAFPVVNGIMSWDSAWPWASDGKANVSCTVDQQYMTAAKEAKKTFMMRLSSPLASLAISSLICSAAMSSFQFKHLDPTQNWYRRGELTLAERIPQVLSVQPHFLQIQTWNDAGESSYIGNVWPETIGAECAAYTDNFDHSGWQALITPFISAYKAGAREIGAVVPLNGAKATGVFWYRSILTTATCAGDPLGKPRNWSNAEDVVNVAVLLAEAAVGAKITVYSGGMMIGSRAGIEGLNAWSISGLKTGAVKVEVMPKSGSTALISGTGSIEVVADAAMCNYNYQVMSLK
jgi:glucan endo-1,3-alpha-glucosidase